MRHPDDCMVCTDPDDALVEDEHCTCGDCDDCRPDPDN
jgi:hypothetical protein